MSGQLCLPLPGMDLTISGGLDLERAVMRACLRRRVRRSPRVAVQLAIEYSFGWRFRSRGTRRPAKYPFEMVTYARKLRGFGFFYREIAEEILNKFKVKVPWITVRDWTNAYYRMSP